MNRHKQTGYLVRSGEVGPVTFLASSPEEARDGLSIPVESWDTRNYERNPVVLFGHDYSSLPIGRTIKLDRTPRGLVADIEFDQQDPEALRIERKIRNGLLNAVSVGFRIDDMDGSVVKRAELLEISVVPVPADVNAVALARSIYSGPVDDDQVAEMLRNLITRADLMRMSNAVDRIEANLRSTIRSEVQRQVAGYVRGAA